MSLPISILGLGAEGLSSMTSAGREALRSATFVAGGKRHLGLIAFPDHVETFAITDNISLLVQRLRDRGPGERCVVLASGDPLCFGAGASLRRDLAPEEMIVEPALSSLQLAFARAVIPWTDAAVASIHGRPLKPTLIPLLGRPRIGLFTQDGQSPSVVAQFFLDRGLSDYRAWICENLGADDERVTQLPLAGLPGRRFGDLNFLVLSREESATPPNRRVATPSDQGFSVPSTGPVLLTHRDVRAVALSRFNDLPSGPIWDVGAGLGGISVGLANQFPHLEVVAVERDPTRFSHLEENRRRFEAWNLRLISGLAPEVLAEEERPAGIFLGGSGGNLVAILEMVIDCLLPGGTFVADFVGLENLAITLEKLRAAGWASDLAQVQISLGQNLAGLTTLAPIRPVWIVHARKPGGSAEEQVS